LVAITVTWTTTTSHPARACNTSPAHNCDPGAPLLARPTPKPLGVDRSSVYYSRSASHICSLCFHIRPINPVIYGAPQGELILKPASRLDAFSGYPSRT